MMRFRIMAVIFLAIVLSAIPVVAQDPHGNLLDNPGFEQRVGMAPPSWNAYVPGGINGWDGTVVQATNEAARTGNVGVRMAGSTSYIIQIIGVEGGKPYELSAWQKGDGNGAFKLEYINDAGRTFKEESHSFTGTADWTRQSMESIAPEEAVRVRVFLRLFGNGTIHYDDVSFRRTDLELEVPPVPTESGAAPAVPVYEVNPQAIEEIANGTLTEANAAWWGFDPVDATMSLQAAIDSGASRVIVPNMGTDWVVRPIHLRSNLELVLEEGVVIQAKKGEYLSTSASVFNARDVDNLIIRGYGATIRMHKDDYTQPPYAQGEWRMGINIRGGKDVQILGLTIRDTGGDGIYLGTGTRKWNENVIIRDVVADNNHRQGISVISVKNLLIENSVFKNTTGTAPMAGIDFEPNGPEETLENVVIRNSVFENNDGPGIAIYPGRLAGDTQISFLLENIVVRGSPYGIHLSIGAADDHPDSEIIIRNCLVEGSENNGIRINRKDGDALKVRFENCVLNNVATATGLNQLSDSVPIYISAVNQIGGITFENVTVIDDQNRPALYGGVTSSPGNPTFFDIHGKLRIVNPHGAWIRWDGPTEDVSLEPLLQETFVIPYDTFVTLPDYQQEPEEVKVGPTIHIGNLQSIRPISIIQGVHRPEIELRYFDEGDIKLVEVRLGDEVIYSSSTGEGLRELEIDTTAFPDDYHDLAVTVQAHKAGRIEESVTFGTHNFNFLVDSFEGPKEVAWFGAVYNPKTLSQSGGWRYETSRPEAFFGDASRKVWDGSSTEYLVWETPGLRGFEVDLYMKDADLKTILTIATSADQKVWTPVTADMEVVETSPQGWQKVAVRHDRSGAGEANFIRLELKPSENAGEIQLGQATFRHLRQSVAK